MLPIPSNKSSTRMLHVNVIFLGALHTGIRTHLDWASPVRNNYEIVGEDSQFDTRQLKAILPTYKNQETRPLTLPSWPHENNMHVTHHIQA